VTGAESTVADARTLVVATGASGNIDAGGFSEISVGSLAGNVTLSHMRPDTGLLVRESISKMVPDPVQVFVREWTLRVELEDASGQSDTLALTLQSPETINVGNLGVPGIEHIIVETVDTNDAPHFNRLEFVDEQLASLVVAGEAPVYFFNKVDLATFDATGVQGGTKIMSGPLSDRATLFGGPGDDIFWTSTGNYTINGGAGNDHFVFGDGADIATGGSGADTFEILRSVSRNEFATITDFTKGTGGVAGDHVDLTWLYWALPVQWITAKVDVGAATTLAACLDTAAAATDIWQSEHSKIRWFQYASDTYIVLDNSNLPSFHEAVDQFVKLVGLIDLSTLTLDANDALG
jgi:Ca2+-binding RTX toxin-like protein